MERKECNAKDKKIRKFYGLEIDMIITGARGTDHPPFSNFLFTNLFSNAI
jgi:hypothetical protein